MNNLSTTIAEPGSCEDLTSTVALHSSRKLRIATESTNVFLAQVVGLAFGVLNNLLIAWLLGPQGKGLIYLVQFTASSAVIFLNLGLGPSAVYHLGRDRTYAEADVAAVLMWPSLLLGALPIVLLGALWPWVGHVASSKFGSPYVFVSLAAIPGMVLAWNVSYLSLAKGRIFSYNLLRVASPAFFFLGLFFLLPFSKYRSTLWVAFAWLGGVSIAALYASWVVRQAGAALDGRRSMLLSSAFRFGWFSHLGAVAQYLQHRIDMVLISAFLPLKDLGIYSMAVAGSELLWYVPHTVATVLMPHVAGSSDEDASRMTSMFCRVIVAMNTALAVILALVSTLLIYGLLPAFRASVLPLWLLLPGTMAASVFKVLSSDFNGRGKPFETFRPAAISLFACLVVGCMVIPRFGVNGAALVTSGGYILNSILYVRAYTRVTAVSHSNLLLLHRKDFSSLAVTVRTMIAKRRH